MRIPVVVEALGLTMLVMGLIAFTKWGVLASGIGTRLPSLQNFVASV
jgi:hypothetical protein